VCTLILSLCFFCVSNFVTITITVTFHSCRKGLAIEASNRSLLVRLQCLRDAGYATDETADKTVSNASSAATFKAAGNTAFTAKKFKQAAEQ
jgi:hypothetical protein